MNNVFSLEHGDKFFNADDLIKELEKIIEKLRRGEINHVSVVYLAPDGRMGMFSDSASISKRLEVLGSMEALKAWYINTHLQSVIVD